MQITVYQSFGERSCFNKINYSVIELMLLLKLSENNFLDHALWLISH